jgi:peptidoglycan/xylan/chitin deacetylase (PgdA/CDA1 family)
VQWGPAVAAVVPPAARALGIPTRLPSRRGVLLSFDDGPHPDGTPAVLAALDRLRAPAVFFPSGEQATLYPELVREIVAAGHEVGLHGYRHQTRRQWNRGLLAADLKRGIEALAAASDVVPRIYRPPHGVFTLGGLRLTRTLGLEPLLWSRWGRDWERGATACTIAGYAAAALRAGDVLLLHDADHYSAGGSWRETVDALPRIADRIATQGLEPARVTPGLTPLELTI